MSLHAKTFTIVSLITWLNNQICIYQNLASKCQYKCEGLIPLSLILRSFVFAAFQISKFLDRHAGSKTKALKTTP